MFKSQLAKHALMLIVAVGLPPLYFALRKRYGVALVVGIIMVVLARWNAYGPLFAKGLSVTAEIIQIMAELLQKNEDEDVNDEKGYAPASPASAQGTHPTQRPKPRPGLSRFND